MLTLLWYPAEESDGRIKVKGHVYTSQEAVTPRDSLSNPLTVTLALSANDIDNQLPNRKEHQPECKQSSWCTRRKPLEEAFKTDGVDEVFLMDQGDQNPAYILEVCICR